MLSSFSDEKIVSLLDTHTLWAKKACKEILKRSKDFIPLLLNVLDKTIENPPFDLDAENRDMFISAAILLAQMKEKAAYDKLLALISFDEDDMSILWGDTLLEEIPLLLRDTFNGDTTLIPAFLENRSVSPWSRVAAINAWELHYFDGHFNKNEMITALRHLIYEIYNEKYDDYDDEIVLTFLAGTIDKCQIEELIPDVKMLYDRNAVDPSMFGDYEGYAADFGKFSDHDKEKHIDDTIQELQSLQWFDESKWTTDDEDDNNGGTHTRSQPKVGRNDPCPCGSGKKYKHCHGA